MKTIALLLFSLIDCFEFISVHINVYILEYQSPCLRISLMGTAHLHDTCLVVSLILHFIFVSIAVALICLRFSLFYVVVMHGKSHIFCDARHILILCFILPSLSSLSVSIIFTSYLIVLSCAYNNKALIYF